MIRDAVFYELRKHVRGALDGNLSDFDFAAESVCNSSNPGFDKDKVDGFHIDTCRRVFDLSEPEPMDTTEID